MKSIIEREANFKINLDIEYNVTLQKIITGICERCTMKQDMLNSQLALISQTPWWKAW